MGVQGDPEDRQALVDALRAGGEGWPEPGEVHGTHGGHGGSAGGSTTVRTTVVDGHEVRIETTYRITVDGRPWDERVEVLDDGRVHYHGLPNYAVASTVDLVALAVRHFGTEPPDEDELGEESSS